MLGQVISRATREQGDRGKPGGQLTEQLNRSGQWSGLIRIIDNRRKRAIEIETDGRYVCACAASRAACSVNIVSPVASRPGLQ